MMSSTIAAHEPNQFRQGLAKIPTRIGLADLVEMLYARLVGHISVGEAANDDVRALLAAFSTEQDDTWRDYALFDENLPYTRNLIASGDDFDLIMICWNPHKRSMIHDHPGSNCWLRVVQGVITERLFDYGEDQISVVPTKVTECESGFLAYINDSIGLHQVGNDTDEPSISLHLYCPRHTQCTVFNEQTGHAQRKNMSYYSVFGERVQSL